MAVQRARQRRRLQARNAVFARQLPDALGHRAHALGDHDRRAVTRLQVFERDREVGRVGDHHVGLGHGRHHPFARHLALCAAHVQLDAGIALAFLLLLAHLLHRHPQHRAVAGNLVRDVDRGRYGQRARQQREGGQQDRRQAGHCRRQALQRQRRKLADVPRDGVGADNRQKGRDQRHLAQVHQCRKREEALHAADRIEPIEARGHRLRREVPATDQKRSRERGHQQRRQKRQRGPGRVDAQLRQSRTHPGRVGCRGHIEAQPVHQHTVTGLRQPRAGQAQSEHGRAQHHQMGQVARARDLSLAASVGQTLGGRLERAVLRRMIRIGHQRAMVAPRPLPRAANGLTLIIRAYRSP